MTAAPQTFTLADVARRFEVPQHRLIHLCEKQIVVPDDRETPPRSFFLDPSGPFDP